MSYERIGTLELKTVFNSLPKFTNKTWRCFLGQIIKMTSQRYQLFFEQGTVCKHCGLKGTFFAIERHPTGNVKSFHLNLYGVNEKGEEILFTKDHIKPRSKGGQDKIENYQVLCTRCNSKKGDKCMY